MSFGVLFEITPYFINKILEIKKLVVIFLRVTEDLKLLFHLKTTTSYAPL